MLEVLEEVGACSSAALQCLACSGRVKYESGVRNRMKGEKLKKHLSQVNIYPFLFFFLTKTFGYKEAKGIL